MNKLTMSFNLAIVSKLIRDKKYEQAIGFITGLQSALIGDFPVE